jgi:magnesium-transporting ATPase (P-type)
VIDDRTGKYNASSPDELALVNAAKFFGAEFKKRDEDNNLIISFNGIEIKYKLLNILEFTSNRKRMSVVVEDPQGSLWLLTKGADSVIFPKLNLETSQAVSETERFCNDYA